VDISGNIKKNKIPIMDINIENYLPLWVNGTLFFWKEKNIITSSLIDFLSIFLP